MLHSLTQNCRVAVTLAVGEERRLGAMPTTVSGDDYPQGGSWTQRLAREVCTWPGPDRMKRNRNCSLGVGILTGISWPALESGATKLPAPVAFAGTVQGHLRFGGRGRSAEPRGFDSSGHYPAENPGEQVGDWAQHGGGWASIFVRQWPPVSLPARGPRFLTIVGLALGGVGIVPVAFFCLLFSRSWRPRESCSFSVPWSLAGTPSLNA
jgi:hypothetical protein